MIYKNNLEFKNRFQTKTNAQKKILLLTQPRVRLRDLFKSTSLACLNPATL